MPGQRLNTQARNLVANLLAYFTAERDNKGPLIPLNAIQERVANALKIGVRTVSKIKIASERNELLATPGKYRPRKKTKTEDLHESDKMDVRNTVYEMYAAKKPVTIKTVKEELRQKGVLDISYGSLRTLLLHLGFKFKKDDSKRALIETPRIAGMRAAFLRKYVENKNSNASRKVVFVGETRICSKGAQDETGKGIRKPTGSNAKKFIVVHAGSSSGFIDNAHLVFPAKINLSDMNGDTFTKWVQNQLIPNLHEPCLIIMESAPCHNVEVERQPSSSWSRAEIVAWLEQNNISCNTEMLKAELLNLVKSHKKPTQYKVDQLLQERGHEVLRRPPYHCEFNAIEMLWADANSHYYEHISKNGCSDAEVLETWDKTLQKFTPEIWYDKVKDTENLIEEWYKREKILEDIPKVMVAVDSEDSSDEEYSSSD